MMVTHTLSKTIYKEHKTGQYVWIRKYRECSKSVSEWHKTSRKTGGVERLWNEVKSTREKMKQEGGKWKEDCRRG